jgi:2-polyprenyl-3-methyl-5-hydroxy-6-metoxy-1,4-benzoquinol methylase
VSHPDSAAPSARTPAVDNFEVATRRNPYFAQLEKEERELIDPATGRLRSDLARFVTCPVCDADEPDTLFEKRGYTFVRCRACTMVYANPQVDEELLERLYEKSLANEMWVDVLVSSAERQYNVPHYEWLLDRLEAVHGGRRLLDVGCSIGDFLAQARGRGWDATGMELGERAIAYARDVHKLSVLDTTLEKATLPDGRFDAVAMLFVLEHLPRPLETLREVRRVLSPGGALAVLVPNVESLAVMALRSETRTFTGRNHPNYFSMTTLTRLLRRAGFLVTAAETFTSSLQAVLNAAQLRDPYLTEPRADCLPAPLRTLVDERREEVESLICSLGLGYRIKLVATKGEGGAER